MSGDKNIEQTTYCRSLIAEHSAIIIMVLHDVYTETFIGKKQTSGKLCNLTCRPLSYYGPSARFVNTSTSACWNPESDTEINCFYHPLSP